MSYVYVEQTLQHTKGDGIQASISVHPIYINIIIPQLNIEASSTPVSAQ